MQAQGQRNGDLCEMKIESIDIKYYNYSGFTRKDCSDRMLHIKQLPYLSIVQSKTGSYGISLDGGAEYNTGEGGFFIAPSAVTQKITHFLNKENRTFTARFIFLNVIINNKYQLDDVFDFPVTADRAAAEIFDRDFDEFEAAEDVCDKMCCIYGIIKHLLKLSVEKAVPRNMEVYQLLRFIWDNYMNDITVEDMADIMNMSESNLYAVFKKATGTSPIKYLNSYRLSVASELLLRTDNSIKTIAENVGIPDQFYFCRLFKEKYSIPPQKYRKEKFY